MYFFRFAHPSVFYIGMPVLALIAFCQFKWRQFPAYCYPLASELQQTTNVSGIGKRRFFFLLRVASLVCLIFLIARPQWVDKRSKVIVEGIAMVLVLDVSGSMVLFDDVRDQRSRMEVAKVEAERFIKKRDNDEIGIVLFGQGAISRCPLTLDKHILRQVLAEVDIGNVISSEATFLGSGLALAINRLRSSKAKNKIVVLLTDGVPTPDDEITPDVAIELAKKFGIKVYTIGVGREGGGLQMHPFGGVMQVADSIDMTLLEKIARETGGQAFRAHNPKDMGVIYDRIDQLEKSKQETDLFHRYYEAIAPFLFLLLLFLCGELLLKNSIWRGIW